MRFRSWRLGIGRTKARSKRLVPLCLCTTVYALSVWTKHLVLSAAARCLLMTPAILCRRGSWTLRMQGLQDEVAEKVRLEGTTMFSCVARAGKRSCRREGPVRSFVQVASGGVFCAWRRAASDHCP